MAEPGPSRQQGQLGGVCCASRAISDTDIFCSVANAETGPPHHEDGHVLVLCHQEGHGTLGDCLLDVCCLLHDLCLRSKTT